MLGALDGEVMVYEPMVIKEVGVGGATVETRFPFISIPCTICGSTLGERSIVVKGRVVHSRISDVDQDIVTYRTGVEFVEPSERVTSAIAEYLRERDDGPQRSLTKFVEVPDSRFGALGLTWQLPSPRHELSLTHFQMFEVVAGCDAFRAPERSIVEIGPGLDHRRRHPSRLACACACRGCFRLAGLIALELVEGSQSRQRLDQLVDLAPHTAVAAGTAAG